MEVGTLTTRRARWRIAVVPAHVSVALWAALIAVAWAWGTALNDAGTRILLWASPLAGRWDPHVHPEIVASIVLAAALITLAPRLSRSLRWRPLLALAALAALAWWVALAFAGGPIGINGPLEGPHEYLTAVPLVESPGNFIATFAERVGEYPTHVRSHPPGLVIALWSLDAIGLGGSAWAAALVLLVAASSVPAVLLAARSIAGEEAARRAAPFVALAPGAVWIATTADALFMGIGAWAVALTLLAINGRGRRSDMLALGGGVLFGVSLHLSFGLALLGVIPLVVALYAHRLRPLLVAGAGVAAVVAGFVALGFWWFDGLGAVREQYFLGVASARPYDFFLLSNLAAFAVALGPAVAIALGRIRERRLLLLVAAALAAVTLADLSGMSKGEVERIWLPFLPWVLLAAAALPQGLTSQRLLLGGQLALGVAIQASLATLW